MTKRVSVAKATGCAVVGGRVACWGDNSGQSIAAGSREPRSTAVLIPGVEDAVAVQVGQGFGCAITSGQKLFCFQGGAAREIKPLAGIVDVALFNHMVIGVKKGGSLAAAILSSDVSAVVPVAVPRLSDVTAVSAGIYHVCALRRSGNVLCWGDPHYTGAGLDVAKLDPAQYQALANAAVQVRGLDDAVQLGVGDTHSCAVTRTKGLACWGLNFSGGLGDGTTADQYAAVAVKDVDDVEAVATGYYHTCVLRKSGGVSCFGENHAGQIGAPKFGVKGVVEVQGIAGAVAVAAGDEVSCAALSGGGVSCWGSASRGRLGNGVVTEHATPQVVKGVSGVEMVGVSNYRSCAADSAHRVTCWGLGRLLELGQTERADTPVAAAVPGEVTDMFSSSSGVCALDKAKNAFCGVGEGLATPPQPLKIGSVKAIVDGGPFGTAIRSSGQLMLWKQLSRRGSAEVRLWTQSVTSLSGVVAVASEDGGLCAVRQSGKVACLDFESKLLWNPKGPIPLAAPREVVGVTDAVAIAAGADQMCLLHKGGKVSCFHRTPPFHWVDPKKPAPKKGPPPPIEVEQVEGLTGVVALGMAGLVRCALREDATVSCWGPDNPAGQLGTGDFEPRQAPTPVVGLTDVVKIAVAPSHVCAAKKSGDVMCWGHSGSGETGESPAPFAATPMPVLLPGGR